MEEARAKEIGRAMEEPRAMVVARTMEESGAMKVTRAMEETLDAEVTPDSEMTIASEMALDSDSLKIDPDDVEMVPDSLEIALFDVEVVPDSLDIAPDAVEVQCARCGMFHGGGVFGEAYFQARREARRCARCRLVHDDYDLTTWILHGIDKFDCELFIPDVDKLEMDGDTILVPEHVEQKVDEIYNMKKFKDAKMKEDANMKSKVHVLLRLAKSNLLLLHSCFRLKKLIWYYILLICCRKTS